MKAITKKQSKEFTETFCKMIQAIGAKLLHNIDFSSMHTFELNTRVGLLTISLPKEQTICYTVFSCFEENERASKEFTCNSHSGKYNVHLSATALPEKMAEIALDVFKATLPK